MPLTLVAVDGDALVPATDIEGFASRVKGASFHLISSRFGHDAFLKEERQVGAIITNFLKIWSKQHDHPSPVDPGRTRWN